MNRYPTFSILLAILSLVGIARKALVQDSLILLVKRIQPAVVTVLAYDATGQPLQQGSGFFVSTAGHLVTNRHVLQGASRAEVQPPDGRGYAVTQVVAEDKAGDLVEVVTDMPQEAVRELSISRVMPEVGERVVVVGSPLGLDQTVSEGIVSALRALPGFGTVVQLTAAISSGSSGGPVVNLRGEVIGVTTLQMAQGQNLNFALPGERVLGLKVEKGQTLAEWTAKVTEEVVVTAEGLYSTGLGFVGSEDYAKALPYFEEAVQRNPSYAEAWFEVGVCNGELGRHQEEIAAYQQAIRLKPDFARAYYNLGLAYGELGRYQEEITAFQQAIHLKPDFAEAHYNLGGVYGKLGRYREAAAAFQQAIRLKPDFAEAHCNLGVAYGKLGRWQEAVAAFQQAIHLKPDFAEAHSNLGAAYSHLGRHPKAVAALQQEIRLNPADAKAHNNLGEAHSKLSRWPEAVTALQQAIHLKPDDAEAYYNLGGAYGHLGRHQEAVAAYQQAIRLKPDYAEAHLNLGVAYLILGDRDSALEEYKILRTLDQNLADDLFSFIFYR